jgi:hypothetical protein
MNTLTDMPKVQADSATLQEAIERLILIGVQQSEPSARIKEVLLSLYNLKSGHVEIVMTFSAELSDETIGKFTEILANDEPDLLKAPEYGPSLYIAKGYTLLHNGKLLFSKGKQAGFHFAIQLPVYPD